MTFQSLQGNGRASANDNQPQAEGNSAKADGDLTAPRSSSPRQSAYLSDAFQKLSTSDSTRVAYSNALALVDALLEGPRFASPGAPADTLSIATALELLMVPHRLKEQSQEKETERSGSKAKLA